jgi:hypothetical protein
VYLVTLRSVKRVKEESSAPRNNNFRGLIWSTGFAGGDVVPARARTPVVLDDRVSNWFTRARVLPKKDQTLLIPVCLLP